MVPWLVAIPASLFSGFLSDHLISQGEPWGWEWGSHAWTHPAVGGGGAPPGGQPQRREEAMAPEDQAGRVSPQPFRGSG